MENVYWALGLVLGETSSKKNLRLLHHFFVLLKLFPFEQKPSTFQKNKTQTYEWSLSQSSKFFSGVSNYRATRGWFAYNSAFGSEFGTTVDKMGAHDTALMDFEWPLSDDVFLNTNNLGYSDGEKSSTLCVIETSRVVYLTLITDFKRKF